VLSQVNQAMTGEPGNFITLRFGRRWVDCLIDTGASVSLINEALAKQLKLRIRPVNEANRVNLRTANGSPMVIVGLTDMTFQLKPKQCVFVQIWVRE